MGASPVPAKRSKAEPTPLPNPSHPANQRILIVPSQPQPLVIPTKREAPRRNLLSFAWKKPSQSNIHSRLILQAQPAPKNREFAIPQPRSGARMQPTAQAVGSCWHVAPAPKGRKKETPESFTPHQGIKRVTIRKLPPPHQNHPQSLPVHAPTRLNNHSHSTC
jgi:hypothetical protein